MDESALDFRFGWRWLLPLSTCRTVQLVGFSPEEKSYWESLFPFSGPICRRQPAELFIIKYDGGGASFNPNSFDFSKARFLALVGPGKQATSWRRTLRESFPLVREYCLLPSENPRVVVPLSSFMATKAALDLHRPGRWVARFGVQTAKIMARFEIYTLLRQRVLLIASQNQKSQTGGSRFSAQSKRNSSPEIDYALYLGSPNSNRKTVVLPINSGGPSSILKIAETTKAKLALSNEADVLEKLAHSQISSYIPRSEGLVETEGALYLYQEYRSRKPVTARQMDLEVTTFLGLLSQIESRPLPLSSVDYELTNKIFLSIYTGLYCQPQTLENR